MLGNVLQPGSFFHTAGRGLMGSACAALLVCLTSSTVRAQLINWPAIAQVDVKPVYDLPRPYYDAAGLQLDNFLIKPSLTNTLTFDNNIFASEVHRANDEYNTTYEQIDIDSQWESNTLFLTLQSSQEVYYQHAKEDANLYRGEFVDELQLSPTSSVQIYGVGGQIPELRASLIALFPDENRPIYNLWGGSITYTQIAGPIVEQFRAGMDQIAFIYAADIFASHTDRLLADRLTYDGRGFLNPFIEAGYVRNDQLFHPFDQSFQNLSVLLGLHGFVNTAIDAEAAAGLQQETYTNPLFHPLLAPIIYAKILWNFLPLTSLIGTVTFANAGVESFCNAAPLCEVNDLGVIEPVPSTGPDSNDLFVTHRSTLRKFNSRFFMQHEIWHDFMVEAGFEYDHYDFSLNNLIDDDTVFTTDLRYLINRFSEARISYFHHGRSANFPTDYTYNTGPYAEDQVMMAVKLQY